MLPKRRRYTRLLRMLGVYYTTAGRTLIVTLPCEKELKKFIDRLKTLSIILE